MHEILNHTPNRSKLGAFSKAGNVVKCFENQRLKMAGAAGFEPATYGFGDTLSCQVFNVLGPSRADKSRERAMNIGRKSKPEKLSDGTKGRADMTLPEAYAAVLFGVAFVAFLIWYVWCWFEMLVLAPSLKAYFSTAYANSAPFAATNFVIAVSLPALLLHWLTS